MENVRMDDLSGVRVVFLDAAGTLFRVNGSVGGIYARMARHYGVDADPQLLERLFADAFRSQSAAIPGVSATAEQERRWWHEIVWKVFGSEMPRRTFDSFFHEVFEFFRKAEAWELYGETLGALDFLRHCGYRLGIISNFDSRLNDLLENLGISRFFDAVVLSWQTGAAKPDTRIFQAALQQMHAGGAEALHIGDSCVEDYQGARRAGMHAILLDRSGKQTAQSYAARTLMEAVRKLNHKDREDR
jgi:putative hydrolase of the HAD superfamily